MGDREPPGGRRLENHVAAVIAHRLQTCRTTMIPLVKVLGRRVYPFARRKVSSPDHLSRGIGISMRYQYLSNQTRPTSHAPSLSEMHVA